MFKSFDIEDTHSLFLKVEESDLYLQLVGMLLYVATTAELISNRISRLTHFNAERRIISYLMSTMNNRLILENEIHS